MPIREDKASKSAINLHQIDININKISNEINNGSSSSCFEQPLEIIKKSTETQLKPKSLERTEATRELLVGVEEDLFSLAGKPNDLQNTCFNNTSEIKLYPYQDNTQQQKQHQQ